MRGTERQQIERALRESREVAGLPEAKMEDGGDEVYQPENKKLSRASKELAALAPWAWDPNVNKRPPGRAMLRDFAEVVAESATLVQHLGGDGSAPLASDGSNPLLRTSKPRAARASNFAGMSRGNVGGDSDTEAPSERPPRKRGRPSAASLFAEAENDGAKRPRAGRASFALATPVEKGGREGSPLDSLPLPGGSAGALAPKTRSPALPGDPCPAPTKRHPPEATPLSPRPQGMSPVPFPSLDAVADADPAPGRAKAAAAGGNAGDVFGSPKPGAAEAPGGQDPGALRLPSPGAPGLAGGAGARHRAHGAGEGAAEGSGGEPLACDEELPDSDADGTRDKGKEGASAEGNAGARQQQQQQQQQQQGGGDDEEEDEEEEPIERPQSRGRGGGRGRGGRRAQRGRSQSPGGDDDDEAPTRGGRRSEPSSRRGGGDGDSHPTGRRSSARAAPPRAAAAAANQALRRLRSEAMDEDGQSADPQRMSVTHPDQLPPPMFARGVAVRPRHMKATPRAPAPQLPSPLAYFARGGAAAAPAPASEAQGSGAAESAAAASSGGLSSALLRGLELLRVLSDRTQRKKAGAAGAGGDAPQEAGEGAGAKWDEQQGAAAAAAQQQ